jgi:hypothetical protein
MVTKTARVSVPEAALKLPRDYDGYVFISDIDKTYLATQIDSLGGLLRAAFETPERKANVPGFSIILRAVRRGAGGEALRNPLFFVSASPPQMEQKLRAKMALDGVEPDGVIFKNQMRHVRSGNFKKLREQIGYKLNALLALWEALPPKSKIVLFGDDSESDAVIYSLFSEIANGQLSGLSLFKVLDHLRVSRDEAIGIAWYARRARRALAPVQGAFINLETGSQASYYSRFGPFMYATDNSLQTALALYEKGLLREQAVKSVGRDLVLHYDFQPKDLLASLEAASRRGLFGIETLDKLWPMLHASDILPPPVKREANEGLVTRLDPARFLASGDGGVDLQLLKSKYSEEGRY